MRAFMSDRDARTVEVDGYKADYQRAACDEARTIVSEAETPGFMPSVSVLRDYARVWPGGAELAESLTAFVALDSL